jgi:hypothetical protein
MSKLVAVFLVVLAGSALASQEQIHRWKTVTLVAETDLFGDVEVKASADASGNVQSLAVTAKRVTITVPKAWLAKLPAVTLGSIEVRSERGYDPQPWLYVVFHMPSGANDVLHVSFQNGKLAGASLDTATSASASKHTQIPAP